MRSDSHMPSKLTLIRSQGPPFTRAESCNDMTDMLMISSYSLFPHRDNVREFMVLHCRFLLSSIVERDRHVSL